MRFFVVLSKFFVNRMLYVSVVRRGGHTRRRGLQRLPSRPANVDSQAKKVATFEGGDVTQGELDEFAAAEWFRRPFTDDPQYQATIQQIMPQLVSIEIAKAYAEEHNITVSDKEVDQEIEKLKEQVGDQARSSGQDVSNQEAYEQALKQNNITEEQLREDIRENLPVQKVQERVTGNAEPSDEEIQKYYEKNKEAQFTTPEQRCVRHILFNKDQKEKAEDVKQQLENGGDFAKLAKEILPGPGQRREGRGPRLSRQGRDRTRVRAGGLRGRAG